MALRAAIDLVVLAVVGYYVVHDQPPAMPEHLCTSDEPVATEGSLAIVIADLRAPDEPGEEPNDWSAEKLGALYPDADLVRVADDEVIVGAAIETALRDHQVVYYTGHNFQGHLSFAIPAAHRTLIMDTCYSTQLYSRYARDGLDLITNDKPSITGSIETLPLIMRHASFAEINARAKARAAYRPPGSKLYQAERYRRVTAVTTACPSRS